MSEENQALSVNRDATNNLSDRNSGSHQNERRFTLKDWRLWAASFGFFWSMYICGVISILSFERAGGTKYMFVEYVILPLIQDTVFAILAPVVFVLATRFPVQRENRILRSLAYLVGGVFFAAIHVFLRLLSYPAWVPELKKYQWALFSWPTFRFSLLWPVLQRVFLWNLVEDIFAIYIPIVVVAHAALYYRRFRERELRSVQLQAQLSDARLLALKSQLQPHFLFNTLHSISSLMLTDVRAADTMIARLSDLLRMSLRHDGRHLTSFKRELDFSQAYLEIEKIRFGHRLCVKFEVAPETLDVKVPHLFLQPLIENSIKHGISKANSGGEVTVRASLRGDRFQLSVSDRVFGPTSGLSAPGMGVGLKSTQERLKTLFGDDQSFEPRAFPDGAFQVNISLPFSAQERLMDYESRSEGVATIES